MTESYPKAVFLKQVSKGVASTDPVTALQPPIANQTPKFAFNLLSVPCTFVTYYSH